MKLLHHASKSHCLAPGLMLIAFALSMASPSSSDPGPLVPAPPGLHDGNVSALAWDGESLWVGTFDAGLSRLRDGRWTEIEITGAPRHRWINALFWDGGNLWVGSAAGLARWNAESGSLEVLDEIEGPVSSIRGDSRQLVVAGTDQVSIRRDGSWQNVELPGEALHAALIHQGKLWAAGMRGVLQRRRGDWRRYSELNGLLPHSWVTALLVVGDEVWAGTYDAGLVALAGDHPARPLRPGAWVNFNALTRIEDGVAVGTMGDGLLLWNRSRGSWRRLTSSEGLPSDDVTAIVEAGKSLWVGTRDGVAESRR